jgi:predicted PurR-regulated permease PerM
MFRAIQENIRSFLDTTLFFAIAAVGAFTILVDYRYFKKMKFKKDAAATLGIGIAFLLLPFALLLISKL